VNHYQVVGNWRYYLDSILDRFDYDYIVIKGEQKEYVYTIHKSDVPFKSSDDKFSEDTLYQNVVAKTPYLQASSDVRMFSSADEDVFVY
jgi:hypothetical protein